MIYYAGIGSRESPSEILRQMEFIGAWMAYYDLTLRSGGAIGADKAFERGAVNKKEIFTTSDATSEAFDHAAKYHPAWEKCSAIAQALHARNSQILLGRHLNDPVKFVVCWTPAGKIIGGTGQALRIANAYNIPVFNLAITPQHKIWEWLRAQ